MISWHTPYNRFLHLSLFFAVVPWLYSYFNEQHRIQSYSVEQALILSWDKVITQPTILFRRAVIGINCNVDLVVSGTSLLEHMNATSNKRNDHQFLNNVDDLYEAFAYFFSRGAAAERHTSDEKTFETLVQAAGESRQRPHYFIGGNAALMAEKIATAFPRTTAYLVGPIGPRGQALLHPSIVRTNSTRIVKDEVHIIMEYKQGEILGEYVAPASSRGSSVVIEMFFKAIAQFNPDIIILSGVHLLQNQNREMRMEKLRLIKRNLMQVNPNIPIHLELGSIGDADHVAEVLNRIVPNVDSLALNEQELAFFSHVANGPYTDLYPIAPGAVHVHKVVEMLYWLLTTYGHDKSDPQSRSFKYKLSRIHFHSLTFHLMVYRGTDWSNLAAALAAGAKVAGRQACQMTGSDTNADNLELRSSMSFLLDKEVGKSYSFEPQKPIASWMRKDVVFIFTPVLVCKFPTRTVGVDDAISATGLIYSQFYRFERAW
ncbi:putative ADP-dependent glucokinase [Toxocara canis]|uniref:Putative ADP-dependent glucokinase n=1 Tax=Toxocara canis TaxID=6265 RepID=A0A0B2V3T1_TOXCA|nr:putative ADP-dependent glucokinase [Toxocara canis]